MFSGRSRWVEEKNLRTKLFLTKACSTFAVWWCKTGQAFASRKLRWGKNLEEMSVFVLQVHSRYRNVC